jgi:hypothetical protein
MAKPATDPFSRMTDKFTIGDGCWEWTGAKTGAGYGKILTFRSIQVAHRVLYELLVGPVPDGMELDHLCQNKSCVNPGHLEPVTHRENIRRGPGHGKETHCPKGHPYSPENTYTYLYAGSWHRYCKACQTVRNQERRRSA